MPPTSRGVALRLLKQSVLFQDALPARRPFICLQCSSKLLPRAFPTRFFTTSPQHLKRSSASKKSNRKSPEISSPDVKDHVPNNKATANRDSEPDPYDHSELQSAIDAAIARLKDSLTKTRDAGRVSVSMLESLPVELPIKGSDNTNTKPNSAAHKEKATIGGIASVVPKGGRSMQVFCSEISHVKPIYSALQASEYSLAPTLPAANEPNQLVITVPVPPVTAETRAQAAVEAKKVAEKAGLEVRNARGDAQKRFRKMELQKIVVKDELHKAHKGMEEVAKKGQDEVKKVLDGALRILER